MPPLPGQTQLAYCFSQYQLILFGIKTRVWTICPELLREMSGSRDTSEFDVLTTTPPYDAAILYCGLNNNVVVGDENLSV